MFADDTARGVLEMGDNRSLGREAPGIPMAHTTNRITHFPGSGDPIEPLAPVPSELPGRDRDPTREIRDMLDDLQAAARDARRRQRQAEEECEQLRERVAELERRIESGVTDDTKLRALTRERDLLAEQQAQYGPVIADLKHKLTLAEAEARTASDRLADRLDLLEREKKGTQRQIQDLDRRREDAMRQKDAASRQRDLAIEEREKAIEQATLAKKNFTDAQKAIAELRNELAASKNELAASKKKGGSELSAQLASLRQARDGMSAQIRELKDRIVELDDQAAEATDARDKAVELSKKQEATIAELRQALDQVAERTVASECLDELRAELATLRAQHTALQEERNAAASSEEQLKAELEALRAAPAANPDPNPEQAAELATMRQKLDALSSERDSLKAQLANATAPDTSEELARLRRDYEAARAKIAAGSEIEAQFEKRRLDMIELSAQLENAHREIRNLSAKLAETRLQAKSAPRAAAPAPLPASEPGTRDEILGMRRAFQSFSRDQKQLGLLNEIETCTLKIADEAMQGGRSILHRVATAFAGLLTDLIELPDQISQSTLRTINQSIEFLAQHLAEPELENRVKLGEARVYVVDDDPNTCTTVVDALNLVGLKTNYALYSSAAVAELAGNRYDLIILDVHLPDLDGFELCSHVRTMALHGETPIFFMTGDATLENRVKSSLSGGNEFMSKPFNIQEIALRALKSVIGTQLRAR